MKSSLFKFIILLPVLVFANDLAQKTQQTSGANTSPPEMPIPAEFSKSQPATAPAQPQVYAPHTTPHPAVVPNAPPMKPEVSAVSAARADPNLELIAINPYFRNKSRVGLLTATLSDANGGLLGSIKQNLGDCKNCVRGASLKGKLGVRLYGQSVQKLTVSRKSSSSIKILSCPSTANLDSHRIFVCEFSSGGTPMKLTLMIEP